jgi:hypothetical protein
MIVPGDLQLDRGLAMSIPGDLQLDRGLAMIMPGLEARQLARDVQAVMLPARKKHTSKWFGRDSSGKKSLTQLAFI